MPPKTSPPLRTPRTRRAKTYRIFPPRPPCPPWWRASAVRQTKREQFRAIALTGDGDDDVLLAVVEIRHRRSGLRRRHVHGAELRARRLVVRAQHRAALPVRRREESAFAGDHQRLGHQHADATLAPRARNRDAFERRVILDVVRRLAVRDLPRHRPLVHVERGDASVRRLDERKSLNGQAATAFAAASAPAPGWGLHGSAGLADSDGPTTTGRLP